MIRFENSMDKSLGYQEKKAKKLQKSNTRGV